MLKTLLVMISLAIATPLVASPADSTQADSAKTVAPTPAPLVDAELQAFYDKVGLKLDPATDSLALYAEVKRWYRTPYRYGGRTCQVASDCSGFTSSLYRILWNKELSPAAPGQWPQCNPVPKDSLKTGDLVFFSIGQPYISHVGIYLKDNKFAHAACCCGVIVEDLRQPYYTRWWYGAGRVKE